MIWDYGKHFANIFSFISDHVMRTIHSKRTHISNFINELNWNKEIMITQNPLKTFNIRVLQKK